MSGDVETGHERYTQIESQAGGGRGGLFTRVMKDTSRESRAGRGAGGQTADSRQAGGMKEQRKQLTTHLEKKKKKSIRTDRCTYSYVLQYTRTLRAN